MSNIIDEIHYEENQERITNFIVKYLLQIILIFILILFLSSLYIWNKNRFDKKSQQIESIYNQIFDQEKKSSDKINIIDQVIKKDHKIYSQLAKLEKGSLLVKENKINDALIIYDQLYNSKKTDHAIRNLAKLLRNSLLIQTKKNFISNGQDEDRYNYNEPFHVSMLLSQIEAMSSEKKYQEAIDLSEKILIDQSVSPIVKKKIETLIRIFKIKINI